MANGPYLVVIKDGFVYVLPVLMNSDKLNDEELSASARIVLTPQGTVAKNVFGKANG